MSDIVDARILRNGRTENHLEGIRDVISDATTISIAVAFLKNKGLEHFAADLWSSLKRGARVEFFVGRDFCHTEPIALERLLNLAKRNAALEVFLAKEKAGATFHPKIYMGRGPKRANMIIGSANLTGGALTTNEEVSLSFSCAPDHQLAVQTKAIFDGYRGDTRFEELDPLVLSQYSRSYSIRKDAERRAKREIDMSDMASFDLATLDRLYDEFLKDQDEVVALLNRRRNRERARRVQREIAQLASSGRLSAASKATFRTLFRDLVTSGDGHRHLWHSGDIHRRAQAALDYPRATIELFKLAQEARRLPPDEAYGALRGPALAIKGVGINVVSELLCTFAPKRYAVFNGNTAAALRCIGADVPRSVTLFSPSAYSRVCGVVDAVRRRTGGQDMSDADAFLNWIYQEKVKGK